jgi:hypothetical protein
MYLACVLANNKEPLIRENEKTTIIVTFYTINKQLTHNTVNFNCINNLHD